VGGFSCGERDRPPRDGRRVLSIALVTALSLVRLGTEEHEPLRCIFEVVSAFTTCGLSTGITADLTLAEADLRRRWEIQVLGVRPKDSAGAKLELPGADDRIAAGDTFMRVGGEAAIRGFLRENQSVYRARARARGDQSIIRCSTSMRSISSQASAPRGPLRIWSPSMRTIC
jgi:hypothetical protein